MTWIALAMGFGRSGWKIARGAVGRLETRKGMSYGCRSTSRMFIRDSVERVCRM